MAEDERRQSLPHACVRAPAASPLPSRASRRLRMTQSKRVSLCFISSGIASRPLPNGEVATNISSGRRTRSSLMIAASSVAISGNALPAMLCKSPHMPIVESITLSKFSPRRFESIAPVLPNVGVKGRQFGGTAYDKAPALGLRRHGISFPPVSNPRRVTIVTKFFCHWHRAVTRPLHLPRRTA